jgi:RNA polymerase sigma factor (sigma-70 family)
MSVSDTQLYDKYFKLCLFLGNKFGETYRLVHEDREDLVSTQYMTLCRIKPKHRMNYNYIKVALKNTCIKACETMVSKNGGRFGKRMEDAAGLMRPEAEDTSWTEPVDHNADFAQRMENESDAAAIGRLLYKLPDSERVVVSFVYGLDGCFRKSVPQIARKLHHRQEWVKARLERGLARLKELSENGSI